MAKIEAVMQDSSTTFKSYTFTLTANGDYVEIPTLDVRDFSLFPNGLSADEIQVFGALVSSSSHYDQIKDEAGASPFQSDQIYENEIASFAKIKIVRAGAGDPAIACELSCVN